jgi:hypothetical protein
MSWPTAAIALAGLMARVTFSFSPSSMVNSDEAITSLMAISVTKGEFPTIVGGNNYGGVAEAYILALPVALMRMLKLVGGASLLLDAVNIALHAVLFWILYCVYRRFVTSSVSTLIVAPLWLMSSASIVLATQSYLGYVTGVLAAVLSVGLMLDEQVSKLSAHRTTQTVVAGFLAGFAFWQHPIVGIAPLAVLVVASVSHLVRFRVKAVVPLLLAAVATLVGAAPFIWRAVDQWGNLPIESAPLPSTFTDRFRFVFSEHIPRSLGLRTIDGAWLVRGLGIWLPIAVFVGFVLCVWRCVRKGRWAALGLLTVPILVAAAPATVWVSDGRYGFLIVPPLSIAVAASLEGWEGLRQGWTAALLALAALVGFGSISRNANGFRWRENEPIKVVQLLDSRNINAVRGDYWVVYRIAHVSSERIAASDWDLKRIPRLERRVEASTRRGYVLIGAAAESRVPDRDKLERIEVGQYIVYLPPKLK